jgi:hypothetical protein
MIETKNITSLSTFTQGEASSNLCSDIVNKFADKLDVVSRHDLQTYIRKLLVKKAISYHSFFRLFARLGVVFGEGERNGDICGADEELRSVVTHEGSVTSA